MATSNSDWTMEGLNNPHLIQKSILDRLEQGAGIVVVDNNNPASILMEGFSEITASAIKMVDDTVRPAIYPARAVTTSDIYKHTSNYDYVNMISSPASTTIIMIVDKTYVLTHSVKVPKLKDDGTQMTDTDGNPVYMPYKKIVIPKSTLFTVGDHTFSIYYPIEIRSNEATGRFTVVYDNSEHNPLKDLETNVLEFDFREYNGHYLAYIKIPVYQFSVASHDIVLVAGAGYKKAIAYKNRFYALRCFAEVLTNFGHDDTETDTYAYQELNLAISGQTYDPRVPTVIFTPDEDTNQCLLEIPYVYFTEKRIRGTLHVDLMTTEGELNYKVPVDSTEVCTIDMFSNVTTEEQQTYAAPFKEMPALRVIPYDTNVIGGSNGLTFDEIRDRVINGVNTTVLQTPSDIDNYFAANGYTTTLLRDGITDRIFLVHTPVKDTNDDVIGCDTIGTLFDFREVDSISSIVQPESGTVYTILPSTLYRFDAESKVCKPLTDAERLTIRQMTQMETVGTFNSNVFTLSPFHLQISATNRYPTTITYDMKDIDIRSRTFVAEREDSNIRGQMNLNSVSFDITRGELKDDYQLTFRVGLVNIDDIPVVVGTVKNFRVLLAMKNDDGNFYYAEAQYDNTEDGYEVFHLKINPSYVFHQANNNHTVQMGFWDNPYKNPTETAIVLTDFFLTSEARVILLANRDAILDDPTAAMWESNRFLETDFTSSSFVGPNSIVKQGDFGSDMYAAMSEYKLVLQFGSVVDELDQRINLTYSEAVYLKHLTTRFRQLEADRYLRDENGNLVIDITKPREEMVTIEYKKDTLTCLTVKGPESVVPNQYTAKNYLGCHLDDESKTKITQAILDEAVAQKKALAIIDSPTVPRFYISDTPEDNDSLKGKYELQITEETSKIPLSSMKHVWAMVGAEDKVIKTVNALKFILGAGKKEDDTNGICDEINDESLAEVPSDECPIDYLKHTYETGAYVFIPNDASERDQIQIGQVGPEDKDIPTRGRLYYKFRTLTDAELKSINPPKESSTWYCIVQGCNTLDEQGTVIKTARENIWDTIIADENETVVDDTNTSYPKYYGFAYVLTDNSDETNKLKYFIPMTSLVWKDNYTIPDFKRIEQRAWEAREAYVETKDEVMNPAKRYFYNKNDGNGYKEIPYTVGKKISALKEDYNVTVIYYLQSVVCTEVEFGWEHHANRWPWDVVEWMIIEPQKITESRVTVSTYKSIVTDEKLVTKFDFERLRRYCDYMSAQIILDEEGQPIEDTNHPRSVQYLVDMLQLDAKHTAVTANVGSDGWSVYPDTVIKVLRTHFYNVGRARDTMFTNTRLFFEPIKSLGYGSFNVGNNVIKELPLDITMSFRLHVTQSAYEDDTLLSTIRNQIIDIIDNHIDTGYVNCAEIASTIIEELSDSVVYVDILGINGDPDLQTMKCVDTDVCPHLKHSLEILDDGVTIDITRGLDLDIVVNE